MSCTEPTGFEFDGKFWNSMPWVIYNTINAIRIPIVIHDVDPPLTSASDNTRLYASIIQLSDENTVETCCFQLVHKWWSCWVLISWSQEEDAGFMCQNTLREDATTRNLIGPSGPRPLRVPIIYICAELWSRLADLTGCLALSVSDTDLIGLLHHCHFRWRNRCVSGQVVVVVWRPRDSGVRVWTLCTGCLVLRKRLMVMNIFYSPKSMSICCITKTDPFH